MKRKLLIVATVFVLGFSTSVFADCRDGEINHGTRQCGEPANEDGEVGHGNFVDGELNHGNLWAYFLNFFSK